MRNSTIILAVFAIAVAGCRTPVCRSPAVRSTDDIIICKLFYSEALIRMDTLKHDVFLPGGLTLEQLYLLTPSDRHWREAQFFVLSNEWAPQINESKIVIVCGQSRVSKSGHRVHCVGYNSGKIGWLSSEEFGNLQLREFSVLPKTGPWRGPTSQCSEWRRADAATNIVPP